MSCQLGATFAPAALVALAKVWTAHGGINSGIVGSRGHRTGYHLGEGRIEGKGDPYYAGVNPDGSCAKGLGNLDYSVGQFARDRAGLTDAACAVDLSGPGDMEVAFAKWLIAQARAGARDTKWLRAVNYEWMRWDRIRGESSAPYRHGVNEAGHCHLEAHRDTLDQDLAAVVRRYFEETAVLIVEDSQPQSCSIPKGTELYDLGGSAIKSSGADQVKASPLGVQVAGDDKHHYRLVEYDSVAGTDHRLVLVRNGAITMTPIECVPEAEVQATIGAAKAIGYAEAKTRAIAAVEAL